MDVVSQLDGKGMRSMMTSSGYLWLAPAMDRDMNLMETAETFFYTG